MYKILSSSSVFLCLLSLPQKPAQPSKEKFLVGPISLKEVLIKPLDSSERKWLALDKSTRERLFKALGATSFYIVDTKIGDEEKAALSRERPFVVIKGSLTFDFSTDKSKSILFLEKIRIAGIDSSRFLRNGKRPNRRGLIQVSIGRYTRSQDESALVSGYCLDVAVVTWDSSGRFQLSPTK
jgi:hypothetical protein